MPRICVINIQKEEVSQRFMAATEKALEKVRPGKCLTGTTPWMIQHKKEGGNYECG